MNITSLQFIIEQSNSILFQFLYTEVDISSQSIDYRPAYKNVEGGKMYQTELIIMQLEEGHSIWRKDLSEDYFFSQNEFTYFSIAENTYETVVYAVFYPQVQIIALYPEQVIGAIAKIVGLGTILSFFALIFIKTSHWMFLIELRHFLFSEESIYKKNCL